MYEGSCSFDPNKTVQQGLSSKNGYSQTFNQEDATSAMEIELQQQLNIDQIQDMSFSHYFHQQNQHLQQIEIENGNYQYLNSLSLQDTKYPSTPNLLNLFHFPRSSYCLAPNGSISFANSIQMLGNFPSSLGFRGDLTTTESQSQVPLNLLPQPPMFMESIQSLPYGCNFTGARIGSLFNGVDEGEGSGGVCQDGDERDFENGGFEFSRGMKRRDIGKDNIEKKRRMDLNDKYQALRSLVPNPTKNDRASIVGDAISYIQELLRTVNELKILVEKKRYVTEKFKRHKKDDDTGEVESANMNPVGHKDHLHNGSSLRSSRLQRKSKNTEVDVRIIDDEVTIKLVQQKRINCLLIVSKVLDDLQLDLQHVAGGLIGDYYSFLFNTKIFEGSIVYAPAIANKLIEVADRDNADLTPTSDN